MKMVGRGAIIIVILMANFCWLTGAFAGDRDSEFRPFNRLSVSAEAAILIDAGTGQVLYAKNPFQPRPPASTTKVITALLAIETGKLTDPVTVSPRAASTEGSSMYLSAGEVLSMTDLLYGALLNSGNDACVAIAEHIAGSTDKFAVLMNVKALALGALQTNFVNPHGLPEQEHYTCAYDLAVIARAALANPTLNGIVSTRDKIIVSPGQKWDRRLQNTNQLLWRYLWADGMKTGTTIAAGQCLVSSASKGKRQLLAVVLRSGDRWTDSIRMFEYGFNRFEDAQVAVAGAEFGRYRVQDGVPEDLPVVYGADLGLLVPAQEPAALEKRVLLEPYPAAPVKRGQVVGSVSYFIHHRLTGRVDLVAAVDIARAGWWDGLKKWWRMKINTIFGHLSVLFVKPERNFLLFSRIYRR